MARRVFIIFALFLLLFTQQAGAQTAPLERNSLAAPGSPVGLVDFQLPAAVGQPPAAGPVAQGPIAPQAAPDRLATPPAPSGSAQAREAEAVWQGLIYNPNQTPRFFVETEYLLWWVRNGPAPVLLTTAPNNGLNANGLTGGVLGQPGTTPVFSGSNLNFGAISGTRLSAGFNFGDDNFWGVEASGFLLPKTNFNYTASGNANGSPLLTIPFLDAATAQQSSLDVVSQNSSGQPYLTGSVSIHSDIETWGYDVNIVAHSIRTANRRIDLLVGFRSLALNENLSMTQNVTALQNGSLTIQEPPAMGLPSGYVNIPVGGSVQVYDSFSTQNRFYGPQVGGRFAWDYGAFSAELTGKIAFGVTQEQVAINGLSTSSIGINAQGGTFALSNNIGNYSQNQFAVVPEIGLKLNYALTSWMNMHIGYNALFWSNVVRPGAQIDTVLNSKLIPTGASVVNGAFNPNVEQARPFSFQDTSFWTQGLNVGLEFRF